MNHLAHLLLAGPDPQAQVGQVLADFVSAREIPAFEPGVQNGIRAHQRIDAFTDGHPTVARSRRRFPAPYRRYAGVLLDIFFDHFLACDWERQGGPFSLDDFSASCYAVLQAHSHLAAPRFQQAVVAMHRDNWLASYRDVGGIERALQRVSRRCRRANPIASGAAVLRADYADLQDCFTEFFPQLREFAAELRSPQHPVPGAA